MEKGDKKILKAAKNINDRTPNKKPIHKLLPDHVLHPGKMTHGPVGSNLVRGHR